MADFPVTGTLPETDAIGEGTGGTIDSRAIRLVCLYILTVEEVIAFLGEQPGGPPGGGGDPEEEPPEDAPPEDAPPITSTLYVVGEDAGQVTMSFVRNSPRPGHTVQFAIAAIPGTAAPNVNYISPASPLTFADGETTIQTTVQILNAHSGTGVAKSFKVRIAPTPSRHQYIRGPISVADIIINGVA